LTSTYTPSSSSPSIEMQLKGIAYKYLHLDSTAVDNGSRSKWMQMRGYRNEVDLGRIIRLRYTQDVKLFVSGIQITFINLLRINKYNKYKNFK